MAVTLGLRMEEMIFNLADTHLFFNDLEVRIKGMLAPVFLIFNLVALLYICVYCVWHFCLCSFWVCHTLIRERLSGWHWLLVARESFCETQWERESANYTFLSLSIFCWFPRVRSCHLLSSPGWQHTCLMFFSWSSPYSFAFTGCPHLTRRDFSALDIPEQPFGSRPVLLVQM